MRPFMSNPCGHPYCMSEECSDGKWCCPYYKPRLFGFIPVGKKLGNWLFRLEERLFFKKYIANADEDFSDFGKENSNMNKKEYIERDALLAEYKKLLNRLAYLKDTFTYRAINLFVARLESEPAADVVEVQHGEWETVHGVLTPGGDPLKRCPYCKSRESEHLDGVEHPSRWMFCPICGAKMDGKGEGNE